MEKLVKVVGVASMFVFSLLMLLTFFDAYVSPSKSTRVFINFFGEAQIELLILLILAVVQSIAFVMVMRELKTKK